MSRGDQTTVKEPPTECLVQLLTLVLKHNNFTFNGEHVLQINGTAIGTKMAPSYANIFMGKLEKINHTICTLQANFLVSFHTQR